jgi:hypothetical protein
MRPDPDIQVELRAAFELSPTILVVTGLADGRGTSRRASA